MRRGVMWLEPRPPSWDLKWLPGAQVYLIDIYQQMERKRREEDHGGKNKMAERTWVFIQQCTSPQFNSEQFTYWFWALVSLPVKGDGQIQLYLRPLPPLQYNDMSAWQRQATWEYFFAQGESNSCAVQREDVQEK